MLLKIKRVHQKDKTVEEEDGGCGRNCLTKCFINGARLPLYTCKHVEKPVEDNVTLLESLLLGEISFKEDYFVTACETKWQFGYHRLYIPGKYGFIAKLNEEEANGFEATNDDSDNSPSVVAVNVSPIEYGHVLLIPQVLDCLPQRIDHKSLLLALHMAVEESNPYFRIGYNSLGAFATINHLHFQAYYLAMPILPIEKGPSLKITTTNEGIKISKLLSYSVRGLLFEGGISKKDPSDVVSNACVCLENKNIPFNILISDSGKQIFLLPQCYAEKHALREVSSKLLDTQVNPAVWEMSGHMVLKRKEDYEGASEEKAWSLLAEVSLSEERFKEVITMIFEAIGFNGEKEEERSSIDGGFIRSNCFPSVKEEALSN
ncbi:unnamed protein product [Eruca vesicaria subsp. sativa]|uniref:GDP-L-galactose phosphorylase n=1 Tax=Eruca vesicaria subsp. sativa TaxID=29727 RepID=A0ABC8M0N1_ERUVS|nr:unnamed protein product [Eruca vesicaria subsp. sativa]